MSGFDYGPVEHAAAVLEFARSTIRKLGTRGDTEAAAIALAAHLAATIDDFVNGRIR